MPLHRDPDRASTPERLPAHRQKPATLLLVPPLPFLPASTASSARSPQVCCTLHPIMGFGSFQIRSSLPRLSAPPTTRILPESAVHTLQSLPLADRRTASPRPLPPRRSTATRRSVGDGLDLEALLCRRIRCLRRCCHLKKPDALLGFAPLQGPPRILRLRSETPVDAPVAPDRNRETNERLTRATRPDLAFHELWRNPVSRAALPSEGPPEASSGVLPVQQRNPARFEHDLSVALSEPSGGEAFQLTGRWTEPAAPRDRDPT